MQFLEGEAGEPPAAREPVLFDLIALRARFALRVSTLLSGQMPLGTMPVDSARSLWQPAATSRRRLWWLPSSPARSGHPGPGDPVQVGRGRGAWRMLTHKDLVVRLNLQGLSAVETARRAYHNPRSVDAYV
jgi:hypothetical protein